MRAVLSIPYSRLRPFIPALLLLLYGGVCVYLFSQSYFVTDAMTWLGVGLFPYLLIIPDRHSVSNRYGWLVVVLLGLSLWLQVRTLQFAVLAVSVLWVVEVFFGKTTLLPLLLMGVLSPVFRYMSQVFSFPIRLYLSEWAGQLLQTAGMPVEIVGNVIRLDGVEFAVDTACMGLEMMEVSILIVLFLLGFYTRKTRRFLSIGWIGLFLTGTFLLNILSNLIRMLLLIVFQIFPEHPAHDAVGILCLVTYVIVPLFFLSKKLFSCAKIGKTYPLPQKPFLPTRFSSFGTQLLHLVLSLVVVSHIFIQAKPRVAPQVSLPVQIEGLSRTQRLYDITQFSNDRMLVYIKPLSAFYQVEHSPLVCWRGGGWQFKQISTQVIDGQEIYTGVLQKGTERLYTAWWFDNGTTQTIRQLDWRWQMLRGSKAFCLINVSVNTPDELTGAVQWLRQKQVLQ